MAQFIQYLYEYEDGKPIRNLGFMKVDKQMDKTVIQIYAKQLDDVQGIRFEREDGTTYLGTWKPMEEAKVPPQQINEMPTQEPTEEVSTYIPPSTKYYEKIRRQDLSRLPRKEWRLANNSFLLHGFYNYHHLLYIEDGDEVWIGVPGIYHEKEKAAAKSFGFTEFQRLVDLELELSEEEKNTYEDFGYWCHKVETKMR